MLPGFRFLFATVVLAVSVLVFGLGAAALLRAAHEEFASLPSWRLAQQPLLAPQFEMSAPTLAMLRIEAPAPRSMVETTRPQALRPETIRLDAMREAPDPKPGKTTAPGDDGAAARTEPSPLPNAPAAETVAGLNAQANIDATPAAGTPVEETRTAETNLSEPNGVEPVQPETNQPDPNQTAAPSSETEASEPTAPEAVSSLVRSSEATAADTLPKPVMKKAKRPSARAIARRRLAIARARAARERTIMQQPRAQDPLSQLFGGSGGGNVPRPSSG
jgi:hypothetical protein